MKNRGGIYCFLLSLCSAAIIFGCVAPAKYGRISKAGSGVTIAQLVTHWEQYQVSWAGVSSSQPNAILFDPKGDDRAITLHPYWAPVKDKSELSEIMGWMGPAGSRVALYEIKGPDDQVYGFIYMANVVPLIRVVDEKTLWVGNMTLRNIEGTNQN